MKVTNRSFTTKFARPKWHLLLLAVAMGLLLAWPAASGAQNFTFTKIADTSTSIPGGTGNFTWLDNPSLDGGSAVFRGAGSYGQVGIYLHDGSTLTKVVDTNTVIPGETDNFIDFGQFPSLDSGKVAFWGLGPGQSGIYKYLGSSLNIVADNNTTIPGGTGNFTWFGPFPSIDGGNVAFNGVGTSGQLGVYVSIGGTLSKVADTNTPIPGGTGNFIGFVEPSLSGGNVAFAGKGASWQEGHYKSIEGTLEKVADRNTPIPSGTGNFVKFGVFPSLDGENVVILGFGYMQEGVYTDLGGSLMVVADMNTRIPCGKGTFTATGHFRSLDSGNVVYVGRGTSGQQGIYASIGGTLMKVIDVTDSLDGKTVFRLDVAREAMSGTSVAFKANFTDGSHGIYRADLATYRPRCRRGRPSWSY